MPTMQLVLLLALALLLAAAAACDLHSRIIPNPLNAAVALLAVPWWIAAGLSGGDVLVQIGLCAGTLILFAACFAAGMMGGGDVKLLAALALWLPAGALLSMLLWMALGGGVLTLAMLVAHRVRRAAGQPEIPYGVAIAGAALASVANLILTVPVP